MGLLAVINQIYPDLGKLEVRVLGLLLTIFALVSLALTPAVQKRTRQRDGVRKWFE
jgi:hypothetical protein